MAATTMTAVDNILKEIYEGGVNDQLQSEVTALKRIEKSSEGVTHEVGGKYVRFPIRTKRNHGIGARLEEEVLPVPQTQSYASAQVKLKYLYGALQLTGQTFELAKTNPQAFASALDQEVNGLKEGLRKDLARQVYGDGSGALGVATGGTINTFVIPDAQSQYIEVGMIVDIYDSTGTTLKSASATTATEVTNITSAGGNTTVTFTPAATAIVAGDIMFRDNSKGKEITGLKAIIAASGAVYNIDPASVPVWKSFVDSNAGTPRALTEGLMISTIHAVRRLGGGVPTVGFASLGVQRAYFNLLVQQRRITNTQEFSGGFKGLAFSVGANEIPLVEDVDAPANQLQFVNEKELKIYEAGDWEFMNRDGSNWQRIIATTGATIGIVDAYSATLYKYMELGTHRRNAHAKIVDLIEG